MNAQPPTSPRLTPYIAATAAAAASLVMIELLRAMRSSIWVGFQIEDLVGLAAGWIVYGLALAPFSGIVFILDRAAHGRRHNPFPVVFTAATLLWITLSHSHSEAAGVAVGGIILAATGLLFFLVTRKRPVDILTAGMGVILSAFGGLASAAFMHQWLLLDSSRPAIATVTGLVVFGYGVVVTAALTRGQVRRARWVVTANVAIALALVTVPMLLHLNTAAPDTRQPSLLLVTSDTFRAGYSGLYGGPVPTPHLESLAGDGVVFKQSYSLAPWTLPSMLALMSSTYPISPSPERTIAERREEVGAYHYPDDMATLAERLKKRGYTTGAFVANTLLDDPNGILRGFDAHIVVGHRTHVQTGLFECLPLLQTALRHPFPGLVRPRPVDTTRILTAYARRFLDAYGDRPFFLWLHYMDPHTAYDPPDRYRTETGPWPVFCNADPYWNDKEFDQHGIVIVAPENRGYVRSLYQGEIRYVDDAVGELREALRDDGVEQDTYFCFTSDHGEELWDHGEYGHGQSLHEELVRVPLVISGPDVVHRQENAPFSAIHVLPTLADLLHLNPDPMWRGESAASALRQGQPALSGPVFAQATHPSITEQPWQMVRQGKFKLLRGMATGEIYLFDLDADPAERANLAEQEPERIRELQSLLNAWQTTFPYTFSTGGTAPEPRRNEVLQRLEDLGYL